VQSDAAITSPVCDELASTLGDYAEGVETAPADVRAHVETCLRCQAELVQYRRLLKGLHSLRTEVLEPAPGALAGILASLEAAGERSAIRSMMTGKKAAYVGGISLATAAAGVAGAVVLAGRARRRALKVAS
jgi:hypothetical protein